MEAEQEGLVDVLIQMVSDLAAWEPLLAPLEGLLGHAEADRGSPEGVMYQAVHNFFGNINHFEKMCGISEVQAIAFWLEVKSSWHHRVNNLSNAATIWQQRPEREGDERSITEAGSRVDALATWALERIEWLDTYADQSDDGSPLILAAKLNERMSEAADAHMALKGGLSALLNSQYPDVRTRNANARKISSALSPGESGNFTSAVFALRAGLRADQPTAGLITMATDALQLHGDHVRAMRNAFANTPGMSNIPELVDKWTVAESNVGTYLTEIVEALKGSGFRSGASRAGYTTMVSNYTKMQNRYTGM